ncbi:MAG: PTS transporter subunit EIIC [Collinsella sp.]
MESIVKFLEKGQPYFDKVSKNIYLQAIKDGFLAAMPIILSSSVFLLISTLPGVVATVGGFTLPDWWNVDVVNFCNKVYNFTMGVVGIMVAGTTASALTGSKNRRMPAGKAINATSTMVAAMCAMLILAVTQTSAKIDGADVSVFFTDNMGTKGLLSSFVAAFATVNIYAFCIKRDITIKLPKEVPGAIAQNFRDIFAFSFSILFVAVIDVICRTCLAVPFANVISTLVSPLFAAADSYAGLALIWFMIPLFWFMASTAPRSLSLPSSRPLFGNITTNLATLQAGGHPALALTENFGNYISELGGTSARSCPIIFLLLCAPSSSRPSAKPLSCRDVRRQRAAAVRRAHHPQPVLPDPVPVCPRGQRPHW